MIPSEVRASALGPSAPLPIIGTGLQVDKFNQPVAPRYFMRPTIHAALSPGAVMTYRFEVTSDIPDGSGNWPSPGNWLTIWDELGVQSANYIRGLLDMATAYRVNILTYTSGTLIVRALQ